VPSSLNTGPTASSTQLTALKAITAINTYFNNFIFQWICGGTSPALNPRKQSDPCQSITPVSNHQFS
jgi:hypothetical protein